MVRAFRTLTLLLTVALAAACSVKNTTAPGLSGPSELALSLTMAATPDTITQDGASQAQVIVVARDAAGKAVASLPVHLEITQGGQIVDYGTLSSKSVVTGSDGRASAVYTAPRAPVVSVGGGSIVTVLATPIGSDYANSSPRAVDIRLVPPGVILPPSNLAPGFTFSPAAPKERDSVIFSAPLCTTTGQTQCTSGSVVSFEWTFGDGGTGSGQVTTHQFNLGTWPVTLTIRDANQRAASVTQIVTVGVGESPKADFVFSPTEPTAGQDVRFNAVASTAAPNRAIVDYAWNYGDGTEKRGMTQVHSFDNPGAYNVTLMITDDAGRTASTVQVVTVK
jgi:plastocyanin